MSILTEHYQEIITKLMGEMAAGARLAMRIKAKSRKHNTITFELGIADSKDFLVIFSEVVVSGTGGMIYLETPHIKIDLRDFASILYNVEVDCERDC